MRIMHAFKMHEISAVTRPAQEGALATIMKRRDDEPDLKQIVAAFAKADQSTGAQSFADLLAASEERQRQYEAAEELWPLFCALQDSLRSIAADTSKDMPAKLAAMDTSIQQFRATVAERFPDMESEIEKLFSRDDALSAIAKAVRSAGGSSVGTKETNMTDTKKIADLEAQVADLSKKLTDATAEVEKMKAAEIEKNDATIEIDGQTFRKSVLGSLAFDLLKKQADDIAKAKEVADLAVFQKAAETEYAALPGEPLAKAKVLRAVSKMDDEAKAELEKMLKAGAAAIGKSFTAVGADGTREGQTATDQLDALAKNHADTHKVTFAKAYDAVLATEEGRRLYAESQKGG